MPHRNPSDQKSTHYHLSTALLHMKSPTKFIVNGAFWLTRLPFQFQHHNHDILDADRHIKRLIILQLKLLDKRQMYKHNSDNRLRFFVQNTTSMDNIHPRRNSTRKRPGWNAQTQNSFLPQLMLKIRQTRRLLLSHAQALTCTLHKCIAQLSAILTLQSEKYATLISSLLADASSTSRESILDTRVVSHFLSTLSPRFSRYRQVYPKLYSIIAENQNNRCTQTIQIVYLAKGKADT